MNYIIEFEGLIEDKGEKVQFILNIGEPILDEKDEIAYFCSVYVPYLFKNPKKIAGIDKKQAVELSKRFVAKLLEGKVICDKNGIPVNLF